MLVCTSKLVCFASTTYLSDIEFSITPKPACTSMTASCYKIAILGHALPSSKRLELRISSIPLSSPQKYAECVRCWPIVHQRRSLLSLTLLASSEDRGGRVVRSILTLSIMKALMEWACSHLHASTLEFGPHLQLPAFLHQCILLRVVTL